MDYARCPKCGDKGQAGEHIGTLLIRATITIYQPGDKPYLEVAHIIKCVRCGYVDGIYTLPKATELGITKDMIRKCYSQMAVDTLMAQKGKEEAVASEIRGIE